MSEASVPTVLICDDEHHVREVLRRRFVARGWSVLIGGTGADAVRLAASHRPHAIVIDLQMPEMNGAEAARKLAESPATAEIPILLLTGRGHIMAPGTLDGTSVRSVLPKPFSASEVVDIVGGLAQRSGSARAPDGESMLNAASVELALERAYESIEMLYRLCGRMTAGLDPEELCDQALDGMLTVTGLRCAAIALRDDHERLGTLSGSFKLRLGDRSNAPDASAAPAAAVVRETLADVWPRLLTGSVGGVATIDSGPMAGELAVHQIYVGGRVCGALMTTGGRQPWATLRGDVSSEDCRAVRAAAEVLSSAIEGHRLLREQDALFAGTLTALTSAIDAKDPYTQGHSERVALMAGLLAEAVGYDSMSADRVRLAGRLHDIGKIGVPDRVLLKPSKLTDEEYELIKAHPTIGYDMLRAIPGLKDVLPAVRHHHERWDGRGYPDRLAGDSIDTCARILAVADTFDAMSSNRAYRSSRDRSEVLDEIRRGGGTQFDPELARVFAGLDFAEFDRLKARHEQTDAGNQRAA